MTVISVVAIVTLFTVLALLALLPVGWRMIDKNKEPPYAVLYSLCVFDVVVVAGAVTAGALGWIQW